ncbi:CxC2 domain-containing protein, partial [Favolaschia claudopus]
AKKRKLQPSELEDPLAAWNPLPDDGNTRADEAEGADAEESGTGEKRKRYDSSDEPMKLWREHIDVFLDELIRHDAPYAGRRWDNCSLCETPFAGNASRFRCLACGAFVQCRECLVARHATFPLHSPEEWNGSFWARTELGKLGCIYQLGHGGLRCPHAAPMVREMVVLDFPRIHTVCFRYCACDESDRVNNLQQLLRMGWYPASTTDPRSCATFDTLATFRLLNVSSNVNVQDFIKCMEKRTDATRVNPIPDRYKGFGLMSRQWSFLKRLKRAGRAHDALGVAGTRNGELAVRCWACPHDGINLPLNWRDVAPEYQFLFMLIIAVDTNFRLRHRLRPNERDAAHILRTTS